METMKNAFTGYALMQTEERNTGAISEKVYKSYLEAGKGHFSRARPFCLLTGLLIV